MPQIGEIKQGRELGRRNNDKHIYIACPDCGKERWVQLPALKRQANQGRCPQCANKEGRGRENSRHWKGGKPFITNGYILLYQPSHPNAHHGGRVKRSRLVLEEKLGRYLLPNCVPHHINGIKDDDRPENLGEMMDRDHRVFHRRLECR